MPEITERDRERAKAWIDKRIGAGSWYSDYVDDLAALLAEVRAEQHEATLRRVVDRIELRPDGMGHAETELSRSVKRLTLADTHAEEGEHE